MGLSVSPAAWKQFIDKELENSQIEKELKSSWMMTKTLKILQISLKH